MLSVGQEGLGPGDLPARCLHERREQAHHGEIERIGGGIVIGNVIMLLWSLQDQRDAFTPLVPKEPPERLTPNLALPDKHMSVLVRSQRSFTVIQMKERGRTSGGFLEQVESFPELRLRPGDLVSRGKQVTGIQAVASAVLEPLRNAGKDGAHLLR